MIILQVLSLSGLRGDMQMIHFLMHGSLKRKWLFDFCAKYRRRWAACAIVAHMPTVFFIVIILIIITVVFSEGMLARNDVRACEAAVENSHRCHCSEVRSVFLLSSCSF